MTRARYERPQIVRHQQAATNASRLGDARARRFVETIDSVPTRALLEEHGSPVFVFSEAALRARARELKEAFTSRWDDVVLAWSYKTNHLDAICNIYHQEGWYAEVVSHAEYLMARRLGVPGNRIVFNGACKPEAALRQAVQEGAFIQIDHQDELDLLERVAASAPSPPISVGIRVNMRLATLGTAWDRFGFNLDSGEALDAARRIESSETLMLAGLHCHIGTFITQPQAYREATRRLAGLAREIERTTKARITVLDLGGGFPSKAEPFTQYGTSEDMNPPLSAFAEAITDELRTAYRGLRDKPTLVLETGRALVDGGGTLLASVVGTRALPSGGRGLVLDAGVNILYTSTWYRHEVLPIRHVNGELEPTTLHGPLCMAIDVVRPNAFLPPFEAGDAVAIRPVGAYNVTQWMQFSQMRPAVVLIGDGGRVDVIRRRETLDDLKMAEASPDRLRAAFDGGSRLPR